MFAPATESRAAGFDAGAGPGRAAEPGFATGESPGRGAGRLESRAAGAAGLGAAEPGVGADGRGPGRGPPVGFVPERTDDAGPGRAPGLTPFDGEDFAANDSRNRRATGASTVDDADFTNSPCSLSVASSSLLVTPSSFANSCTRALPATALLTERSSSSAGEAAAHTTSGYLRWTFIVGTSRCAHECSCLFSRYCSRAEISRCPDTRSALPIARRRSAVLRQAEKGCNHAPRPGSLRRGSGTISTTREPFPVSVPRATIRNRSTASSRLRHPMHVRIGAAWRGRASCCSLLRSDTGSEGSY